MGAAQFLGFDRFIPPFANITGRDILSGVNYASGGSGIRDETGANLVLLQLITYSLSYTCTIINKRKETIRAVGDFQLLPFKKRAPHQD